MMIKISRRTDCQPSEITPYSAFKKRRRILQSAVAAGVLGTSAPPSFAWLWDKDKKGSEAAVPNHLKPTSFNSIKKNSPYSIKDKPNSFKEITNYNNYVEFGYDKSQPANNAARLQVRPWTFEIDGMVNKPVTIDIDTLLQKFPLEERIYRLRCVEAWSMVIPWVGIPMASVLKLVEPLGSAKYVRFTSFYDAKISTSGVFTSIALPYQEGLRLDEAMHPLTLMAVGLYDDLLPNQNGAPLRVVIPWKYGFKGAKSIVRISFTDKQPVTAWSAAQPNEYGFYANVNPNVDHPRWSQAKERRIGGLGTYPTQMFNGYEEQVASLYTGMNLKNYY